MEIWGGSKEEASDVWGARGWWQVEEIRDGTCHGDSVREGRKKEEKKKERGELDEWAGSGPFYLRP